MNYAITVYVGATFELALEWRDSDDVPIDLTGWSALLQVREDVESDVVLLEASSPGTIDLSDAGEITVTVSSAATGTLVPGTAAWDLVLVNPSAQAQPPLIGGTATIRRPVSR